MKKYGIVRVSGKGYENKNVIFKKRRKADYPFLFLSLVFGGVIYLSASAIFHAMLSPSPLATVVALIF